MIAWEKQCMLGQLAYVWSEACSQWGNENASKLNMLKNIQTLYHTQIRRNLSKPLFSCHFLMLFWDLNFNLNIQIWLLHWAVVQSLSIFKTGFQAGTKANAPISSEYFWKAGTNNSALCVAKVASLATEFLHVCWSIFNNLNDSQSQARALE